MLTGHERWNEIIKSLGDEVRVSRFDRRPLLAVPAAGLGRVSHLGDHGAQDPVVEGETLGGIELTTDPVTNRETTGRSPGDDGEFFSISEEVVEDEGGEISRQRNGSHSVSTAGHSVSRGQGSTM